MYYQGNALKQQSPAPLSAFSERLEQAVTRSNSEHAKGFSAAYCAVAELARAMGLADYLRDEDAHRELLEQAAMAFEDDRVSRSWLLGYEAGCVDFRSDLQGWEYDTEAEARLKAAGVTP